MRLTRGNITMDTPEAVDKGVALFAKLEKIADQCVGYGSGFEAVFDAICKNGDISTFERDALKAEAHAIFINFRAQLLVFHAKTTQRAQLKGIDVPQPRDGLTAAGLFICLSLPSQGHGRRCGVSREY